MGEIAITDAVLRSRVSDVAKVMDMIVGSTR